MPQYTINLFIFGNGFSVIQDGNGNPSVQITAEPIALTVNSDDGITSSSNPGATTTAADITIGGNFYAAGSPVALFQAVVGLPDQAGDQPSLYTFFLGNSGTVFGTISNVDMADAVGSSFPYRYEDVKDANYDTILLDLREVAICFAAGTELETLRGAVGVENLGIGDLVLTKDHGLQPIRWIGQRKLSALQLAAQPNLKPIRIREGALGVGVPSKDLIVSPQHRILVRSRIARKMFETDEILVAAKQLLQIEGIEIAEDLEGIEYFHILFDQHEVVISNGAETESLHTGPQALMSVGAAARAEIFALFPQLRADDYEAVPARPLIPGRMGRRLAMRHMQNSQPLVQVA